MHPYIFENKNEFPSKGNEIQGKLESILEINLINPGE